MKGLKIILGEHGKHNQKTHGNWIGRIAHGLKVRILGKPEQKVKSVSPRARKTVPRSQRPLSADLTKKAEGVAGWAEVRHGITLKHSSPKPGLLFMSARLDEPRGSREYTAHAIARHARTQFPNSLVTGKATKTGIEIKVNSAYNR